MWFKILFKNNFPDCLAAVAEVFAAAAADAKPEAPDANLVAELSDAEDCGFKMLRACPACRGF